MNNPLKNWFQKSPGSSGPHNLEKSLSYRFKNKHLKDMALTNKACSSHDRTHILHNERLEFLGDTVFDLCISDMLMTLHPEADEGDLSKMRASLVNTEELARVALSIHLDSHLKWDKTPSPEARSLLRSHPRMLACLLEALVGAVYQDGGFKKAQAVVRRLMKDRITKGIINRDYKSILQEFVQQKFRKIPSYSISHIKGPAHEKVFVMTVRMDNRALGKGEGKNKKQAAQSAALQALKHLKVKPFY